MAKRTVAESPFRYFSRSTIVSEPEKPFFGVKRKVEASSIVTFPFFGACTTSKPAATPGAEPRAFPLMLRECRQLVSFAVLSVPGKVSETCDVVR